MLDTYKIITRTQPIYNSPFATFNKPTRADDHFDLSVNLADFHIDPPHPIVECMNCAHPFRLLYDCHVQSDYPYVYTDASLRKNGHYTYLGFGVYSNGLKIQEAVQIHLKEIKDQ